MPFDAVVDVIVMIGDGLSFIGDIASWCAGESSVPTDVGDVPKIEPQPAPPDVTEPYVE